ncbi:TOPRIM domain-containing protein [Fictibacillus macauensis ZFHKF-1]|uniref:TOPRIM domain-containing protein n=1 Tax=Fictibacillus macauensis ZFHKF-1 TaxID=1196324 RepID=I8AME9_9BACL|nr:toprim domain-containing protein [Fictibacillus macauensis]EIT87147.1 TOPRIM domain-containing protein [Fictibacillus macauensis ZFHKF-1]
MDKVIIVEGKSDKEKLISILKEPVDIICTNGTLGFSKLEELAIEIEDRDVYILVDADEAGAKLRKMLQRELPNAEHLYTHKMYREVAKTPLMYLANILLGARFLVKKECLGS